MFSNGGDDNGVCSVHSNERDSEVWMTILENGWNLWVWLMGVVSRRWVWLVVRR